MIVEPDTDGVYDIHKFRLDKAIPDILTQRAVSALENLRAALDLAVSEVGYLASAPKLDKLAFPFCAADTDLAGRIGGCCNGIPNEIKTLLASYKPYLGGEDVLWAINELCRASKHRFILPVSTNANVIFNSIEAIGGGLPVFINEGLVECSENEIVLARTERGLHYKYNAKLFLGVAFGQVKIVGGKEVFPMLTGMAKAVSVVVDEIEQECRKIGLIS
jgi:hypothetical protein